MKKSAKKRSTMKVVLWVVCVIAMLSLLGFFSYKLGYLIADDNMKFYASKNTFVKNYQKVGDLGLVIQVNGDFDYNENYIITEEYSNTSLSAYSSAEWNKSRNDRYYYVNVYDLTKTVKEVEKIDLVKITRDYDKNLRIDSSSFELALQTQDSQDYIYFEVWNKVERDSQALLYNIHTKEISDGLLKRNESKYQDDDAVKRELKYFIDFYTEPALKQRIEALSITWREKWPKTGFTINPWESSIKLTKVYPEIKGMEKYGTIDFIPFKSTLQDAQKAAAVLDLLAADDQESMFTNLELINTKDGKPHTVNSFSEYKRYHYIDDAITLEEIKGQPEVAEQLAKAGTVPLGVDISADTPVYYDLSQGPLYVVDSPLYNSVSDYYPSIHLEGLDYTLRKVYDEESYSLQNIIEQKTSEEKIILYWGYGFNLTEEFKRIVKEGPKYNIYSIVGLDLEKTNLSGLPDSDSNSISNRGFVMKDWDYSAYTETVFGITEPSPVNREFVSGSLEFVQNGKSIVLKGLQ